MRRIGKNENGTFWVRYCGLCLGNFKTYAEAKKATDFSEDLDLHAAMSKYQLEKINQWLNK
jgi:hypothetical protein